MKHLILVMFCAAVALSSCVSRQTVRQTEGQRDSLSQVVVSKDSLLNAVFSDINAITENLAQIKARENLISMSADSTEKSRRGVEEINGDIAAIDRLLQENKTKIASLQNTAAQLRKANLNIQGLEKTISDLNKQLIEKRAEVEQLRADLAEMGVEVVNLSQQVAEQTVKADNLAVEKTELQDQLNTVRYIVGAEKELRDAQIINKQGFIGRTLTVNSKNSIFDSFTTTDSRVLTEVPIGHKKVTVVTVHPAESYDLITDADKTVVKLVINDPARFWESSKILVISYK